MAESHSKGEQRHYALAPVTTDSRSAMARASDGLPFRPYVYNGGEKEPPAVTAARDRHQALSAAMALRDAEMDRRDALIMPDPEPGYEWRREETCDD